MDTLRIARAFSLSLSALMVLLACNTAASHDEHASSSSETAGESGDSSSDTSSDTSSNAACSLYEQDCPEGEKCAWVWLDADSTHRCVPVTGSRTLGESCQHDGAGLGTDDCDAQSMCYGPISFLGAWQGVCTPFCGGSPSSPVCAGDGVCTLGNISVCLSPCDPLLQDCDGADETCWYAPNANDFVCSISASLSGLAEGCISAQDCVKGLTCVEGSTVFGCTDPGCCAPFCELGGAQPCPNMADGVECVDMMVGGDHANVGICVLPP